MILLRLYLLAGLIAHEAVETLEAVNAIRSGVKRTWLLYTLLPVLQSVYPEIMTSIQHDFKVVRQFKGDFGRWSNLRLPVGIPPL